jgi:GR25 family glycosyltransferase involved in LPS biosynthesis
MPGAVGYAIKPEAARKLVDYYREEYLPADNAMNAFVIKLECHTYLMGRAARAEEGKQSLTATKLWNKKL